MKPNATHVPPVKPAAPTDLVVTLTAEQLRSIIRGEVEAVVPQADPAPSLLDRAGCARALGVCTATVDRLVKTGMPYVQLLDVRRFELDRCLEWLRDRRAA